MVGDANPNDPSEQLQGAGQGSEVMPKNTEEPDIDPVIGYLDSLESSEGVLNAPILIPSTNPEEPWDLEYKHQSGFRVYFATIPTLPTLPTYGSAVLKGFVDEDDPSNDPTRKQKKKRISLYIEVYLNDASELIGLMDVARAEHFHRAFSESDVNTVHARILPIGDDSFICRWATVCVSVSPVKMSYSPEERYADTLGNSNCNHPTAEGDGPFSKCDVPYQLHFSRAEQRRGFSGLCSNFSVDIHEVFGTKKLADNGGYQYSLRVRTPSGFKDFTALSTSDDPYDPHKFIEIREYVDQDDLKDEFDPNILIKKVRKLDDSFLSSIGIPVIS